MFMLFSNLENWCVCRVVHRRCSIFYWSIKMQILQEFFQCIVILTFLSEWSRRVNNRTIAYQPTAHNINNAMQYRCFYIFGKRRTTCTNIFTLICHTHTRTQPIIAWNSVANDRQSVILLVWWMFHGFHNDWKMKYNYIRTIGRIITVNRTFWFLRFVRWIIQTNTTYQNGMHKHVKFCEISTNGWILLRWNKRNFLILTPPDKH